MEELLKQLGLTREEFDKGINDFFIEKRSKSKDGAFLLDKILSNGIPKDRINIFCVQPYVSEYNSVYNEYVQYLIDEYLIKKRDEKINDLLK
jgi:hypothetical protein